MGTLGHDACYDRGSTFIQKKLLNRLGSLAQNRLNAILVLGYVVWIRKNMGLSIGLHYYSL